MNWEKIFINDNIKTMKKQFGFLWNACCQSNPQEVGDLEEKEQEPSRFTHYNFKRVNAKGISFMRFPGIYQVTFLIRAANNLTFPCKQLCLRFQVRLTKLIFDKKTLHDVSSTSCHHALSSVEKLT